MAKIVGLVGTGSGRVGNMVLSSRNGMTVVRPYQPNVANPNTNAQRCVRAVFKLLTQVGARMSPVLYPYAAITKGSGMTIRNAFIKTNYPLVSVQTDPDDAAFGDATVLATQLNYTGSNAPTGGLVLERDQGTVEISGKILSRYAHGSIMVAQFTCNQSDGVTFLGMRRFLVDEMTRSDSGIQIDLNETTETLLATNVNVLAWVEAPGDADTRSVYENITGNTSTNIVELGSQLRTLASKMIFSRGVVNTPSAA